MRSSWHPALRDLQQRFGAEHAGAPMPLLIAVCVIALILIFLPDVLMLVPDLIFGTR